ncbi:LysE/ArgO family amino acid transporter [Microbacterium karelineae]|uniref:LysE/ArgO family amino acid transporter n=1 Tax=Microbacterium karelineae TaxID=2654283 RepID=UPI0012EAD060|nr:LysE family transporter [Microbacterium karelineae]
MFTALLSGLGLCLSLIAAPGAQNVFLLRQGIRGAGASRRPAIMLAAVCLASDIALISAGVGGFGVVIESAPWVFDAARWAGVLFLAGYGLLAGWRAVRGGGETIDVRPAEPVVREETHGQTLTITTAPPRAATALLPAVLACLAITWLNPHTYLDTVLLLGSVSTTYGDARWFFAAGAILGSAAWFAFLTFAARYAARWLRSPLSWRVLDAAIAVVMLGLATLLALG